MALKSTKITFVEDPRIGRIFYLEPIVWHEEPEWIYAQIMDVDPESIYAAVLVVENKYQNYFEPREFKNDIIFSRMDIKPGSFFRIGQQTANGTQRTLFENIISTPELIEKFSKHGFSKDNCNS